LSAQSIAQKPSVALLELEATGIEKYVAQALTNRLRAELFAVDKFTVLERERMEEILREQGFQQTGCVSDACVVQAGKLIGVQQMIAGRIAQMQNGYSIHTRLIDVATGEIVRSNDHECTCDIETVLKVSMKRAAYMLSDYQFEKDYRSPALALILSIAFPGLGQLYNGEYFWKGAIQQAVLITSILIMNVSNEIDPNNAALAITGLTVFMGSAIWSWVDAWSSAKRINREIDLLSGLAGNRMHIAPQIVAGGLGVRMQVNF